MSAQIFLQKLIISIFIGGLIGLEREYSAKQKVAGTRTFSLISFLGMLSVFLAEYAGEYLIPIAFIAVILFVLFFKFFLNAMPIGLTTLFSMILAFLFGLMVGFGLYFEAISAGLITTSILLGRKTIRTFIIRRTRDELIDVIEFAILSFVIYPLIPLEPIEYIGVTFDLQTLWYTAVVVCLISFLSFLAVRKFGSIGILAGTFFGSLLSSTLTIAELTKISKKISIEHLLTAFNLAILTMLIRNWIMVVFIAPVLIPSITIFILVLLIVIYRNYKGYNLNIPIEIHGRKPFSVKYAIKISLLLFIMTTIITYLKENTVGVVLTAFLGGLITSVSSIASILFSFYSGTITAQLAKLSICLATLASLFSDLVLINSFGSSEFKKISFNIIRQLILYGLFTSIVLFFLPI